MLLPSNEMDLISSYAKEEVAPIFQVLLYCSEMYRSALKKQER